MCCSHGWGEGRVQDRLLSPRLDNQRQQPDVRLLGQVQREPYFFSAGKMSPSRLSKQRCLSEMNVSAVTQPRGQVTALLLNHAFSIHLLD